MNKISWLTNFSGAGLGRGQGGNFTEGEKYAGIRKPTKNSVKMDKKGALGAQTMIYVFMFCLILIAGGIVWGILAFFAQDYDFRYADALSLTDKITDCLNQNQITFQSAEQFEKEFYSKCGINKKVIEENFLLEIEFEDEKIYKIGHGDRTQCALSEKNINFPKCASANIADKNIFIVAGANQKSRRIKVA